MYLSNPIFTQGQLYFAVSRVKSKRGLEILCFDSNEKSSKNTTNGVYKEVFQNL
ncbi:hypothetical protein ACS0TY_020040 [Phlomoides rotata]